MSSPTLLELQQDFAAWLIDGRDEPIAMHVAPRGLDATSRLSVYRNIVFNNFTEALATAYPAVRALVGDDFFELLAGRYIRNTPSVRGNLQSYGEGFADLVDSTPEAASLPYLADIARLEWARQECALAPRIAPRSTTGLARFAEDAQGALTFTLHPGLRLLDMSSPALDIWLYCQSPGDATPDITAPGQAVAVWPSGDQVAMQALPADVFHFASCLERGMTLAAAVDHTSQVEEGFDPAIALQWLFGEDLVMDFKLVEKDSTR